MSYLGTGWSFLMTDVTRGAAGNKERLAFIFDNSRVQPSGPAGEVVIPPEWIDATEPSAVICRQLVRTPYAVSFLAGEETFILLTAHVDFGDHSADRIPELQALARWMVDWADETNRFHHNLLVLGDFNIDRRDDDLWKAFTGTGLRAPADLDLVKRTIFVKEGADPRRDKLYDQIAWFGGGFDFLPYVYTGQNLSLRSLSDRISDHYPLWVAFERART